jgi:hypothetical protein
MKKLTVVAIASLLLLGSVFAYIEYTALDSGVLTKCPDTGYERCMVKIKQDSRVIKIFYLEPGGELEWELYGGEEPEPTATTVSEGTTTTVPMQEEYIVSTKIHGKCLEFMYDREELVFRPDNNNHFGDTVYFENNLKLRNTCELKEVFICSKRENAPIEFRLWKGTSFDRTFKTIPNCGDGRLSLGDLKYRQTLNIYTPRTEFTDPRISFLVIDYCYLRNCEALSILKNLNPLIIINVGPHNHNPSLQ